MNCVLSKSGFMSVNCGCNKRSIGNLPLWFRALNVIYVRTVDCVKTLKFYSSSVLLSTGTISSSILTLEKLDVIKMTIIMSNLLI